MQNLTEHEKQQLQTLKNLMEKTTVDLAKFTSVGESAANKTEIMREYQTRYESI